MDKPQKLSYVSLMLISIILWRSYLVKLILGWCLFCCLLAQVCHISHTWITLNNIFSVVIIYKPVFILIGMVMSIRPLVFGTFLQQVLTHLAENLCITFDRSCSSVVTFWHFFCRSCVPFWTWNTGKRCSFPHYFPIFTQQPYPHLLWQTE